MFAGILLWYDSDIYLATSDRHKLLKQSDVLSQDSIPAYLFCIYNTMGPKRTPIKEAILFSTLSVCYISYL